MMLLRPRNERDAMPTSLACTAHGRIVKDVAEIGVYRCSEAEHIRLMSDAEDFIRAESGGHKRIEDVHLARFAETRWTAWRYNEVVGWLRIYAYPKQGFMQHAIINAEFYAIDAKRLSPHLKRKRFLFNGEAFAFVVDEATLAGGVWNRLTFEIEQWAKTPAMRRCVLDLAVWDSIGSCIEWPKFLVICPSKGITKGNAGNKTIASYAEARATALKFDKNNIIMHLSDGRLISIPLRLYPTLNHATSAQRAGWELIGSGRGFHWKQLDLDLSVEGLLHGLPERIPAPPKLKK